MQEITINKRMVLHLTVRQNVTVLPRCLQILSRRGFILTNLATETTGRFTILTMEIFGPERWHRNIAPLMSRLVDVIDVSEEKGIDDE